MSNQQHEVPPEIVYYSNGSLASLNGREAVELIRVSTLIQAIKMSAQSKGKMIITREFGLNQGLKMATDYTGVVYKRTEWQKACSDLKVWLELAKSTIPTRTLEDPPKSTG